MGVIQRQGIKYSIVNFAGLAIGTASTILVYSRKEVVEAYGFTQFLLSIAIIGFPLFAFASNSVAIRFFPNFQDKPTRHHGFLPLLLYMCLAGWSCCAVIALVAHGPIEAAFAHNSPFVRQYIWMALPLTLFYTVSIFLAQYASNFKRIVVPSILVDFSLKVLMPVMMIAIWLGWVELGTALYWLLAHYFLVMVSLMVYLNHLGEWSFRAPAWSFITPALRQDILRYAGFGVVTGLAMLVVTKADTLLVGPLISMKSNAVYAIALNIAAAIEIPTKSLYSASASFVARYLADENWAEMRVLYQKVSINLLAAGLLIFGCIWVSADDLFALMPNSQAVSEGRNVLFFLGLAKLVDMGSGLNNQLVYYSKYYRYSMVSLSLLAMANICFNLWLIPKLGLTGAAISVLLSTTMYNLSGLYLVWNKFHMQPFSRNTISLAGLAAAAMLAAWFLPDTGFALTNIALRSGLFGMIFAFFVLRFRISGDISQLWSGMLARVKKAR